MAALAQSSSDSGSASEEQKPKAAPAKGKGKGKANVMAALAQSSSDSGSASEEQKPKAAPAKGKGKGKANVLAALAQSSSESASASSASEPKPTAAPAKGKGKGKANVMAALAQSSSESASASSASGSDDDEPAPVKKATNMMAALGLLEDSEGSGTDSEDERRREEEERREAEERAAKKAKAEAKKAKAAAAAASAGGEGAEPAAAGGKGKGKKGKGKGKAADDDDLDSILASLAGITPAAAPPAAAAPAASAAAAADAAAPGPSGEPVKSKAQEKRERAAAAKAAEEAKGPAAAADGGSAPPAAKEPGKAKGKGKGKGPSAAVIALREALEAKRAEEEAIRKAEAEAIRLAEEEERKEQEAEAEAARKKAERKQREKEKKEELRDKGLLKSKSQMAKEKKLELFRQQLSQAGAIPQALQKAEPSADPAAAAAPAKKVVYEVKKKKDKKKRAGDSSGDDDAHDQQQQQQKATPAHKQPAPMPGTEARTPEGAAAKAAPAAATVVSSASRAAAAASKKKPAAKRRETEDDWEALADKEPADDWDNEDEDDAIDVEFESDEYDDDDDDDDGESSGERGHGKDVTLKAAQPRKPSNTKPPPKRKTQAEVQAEKRAAEAAKKEAGLKLAREQEAARQARRNKADEAVLKAAAALRAAEEAEGGEDDDEDDEDDDDGGEDDDDEDDDEDEDEDDDGEGGDGDDRADMTEAELNNPEFNGLNRRQRAALRLRLAARAKREARLDAALARRDPNVLRSPIVVIMGHVDTGKTKLLDKIRNTNVQDKEAGGITQQIGATFFPVETIKVKTNELTRFGEIPYNIPGLLIIDTPGHESFSNLRLRGSSLCDIAILVVDIMAGLEQQTLESLQMLRDKKIPFIVALNKIDRMYGWKSHPWKDYRATVGAQDPTPVSEFQDRLKRTIIAFAEKGINAKLYTENTDPDEYISLVPTSAITGEGVPDLLMLLTTLPQQIPKLRRQISFHDEVTASVMEVRPAEGFGTTLDIILVNGTIHVGDTIVVMGLNGPIVSEIRAILTPPLLKEMRVSSKWEKHDKMRGAIGVKISAPGLDKALAGSQMLVKRGDDDVDELKEFVQGDFKSIVQSVDKSGRGVHVQASTLGALEALLKYLQDSEVPVSGVSIGPISKQDVMKASLSLARAGAAKEFAVILAFNVPIAADAAAQAAKDGVRIFNAEIIYHLTDQYAEYKKQVEEARKAEAETKVVFPCVLRIVPNCVFAHSEPIIVGVECVEGFLRKGTPLCVRPDMAKPAFCIGVVASIEREKKPVETLRPGDAGAAIKIETRGHEDPKMVGRHFTINDNLISLISRESLNILKDQFKDELTKQDWLTVIKIKQTLGIQ
jgi:translation initiation factor 5B